MSLHFWMAWCSFTIRLFKATSSNGFIWCDKLNNWPAWYIFIQWHSIIPCSILPFFLLFPVYNVAIFVASVYLDRKFSFLCHASLPSKTAWENALYVVRYYSQFFLPPYFLKITNNWSWWVVFTAWIKVFLGGEYITHNLLCEYMNSSLFL